MKRGNLDYSVLLLVIGLVLFGVLMVFSTSYYSAEIRNEGSGFTQLTKQFIFAIIGTVVMLAASFFDYHWFRIRFKGFPVLLWLIYLGSLLMLVLVLLIGDTIYGAKRWLEIGGVSFQPSEIARFAMLLMCADYLAGHHRKMRKMFPLKPFIRSIAPVCTLAAVICVAILSGKSLSMTACTGALFLVLLFAAGVDWRFIAGVVGVMIVGGIIAIIAEDFRMARVMIFRDPWQDPTDTGYQLVQSLYALGAGGLFGKGLGNGTQKLLYLTFGDSDFILANIGEELGFVGIVLLMGVFLLLFWRCLLVAKKAPDMFGSLLAAGITSLIAIQVILHVAVVTSTFPPTGIPLPFISAGGTSLVMFMGEIGILLNISRQCVRS